MAVFCWKKDFIMNKNIKRNFETLAVAVVCTIFVLSMHQSCSGLMDKFSNKKKNENTEIKNVQEIKNDTIKYVQNISRGR